MPKLKLEKKEIAFSSYDGKRVFGQHFKSGYSEAVKVSAQLLLEDKLNTDGTINENTITGLQLSHVWSYIYYLYYLNRGDIIEFKQMTGDDGLASAERFYDIVMSVIKGNGFRYFENKKSPIALMDLIKFVSKIVQKYGDKLVNPVIQHYNKMVETYLKELDVVVRTGREDMVLVKNASNVQNSDIIIKISSR